MLRTRYVAIQRLYCAKNVRMPSLDYTTIKCPISIGYRFFNENWSGNNTRATSHPFDDYRPMLKVRLGKLIRAATSIAGLRALPPIGRLVSQVAGLRLQARRLQV